jgi:uncharacterized protein
MQMPDVNILVYAHRRDSVAHSIYAEFLRQLVTGPEPFALSETVLHGFVRIVTNRRIYGEAASTTRDAFAYLDQILSRPNCVMVQAGADHWSIFRRLCEQGNLTGKIVSDAAHAALAIENGCEWVTADTDFARFAPLLRWRHI